MCRTGSRPSTKYRTCEGGGTGFGATDDWFNFLLPLFRGWLEPVDPCESELGVQDAICGRFSWSVVRMQQPVTNPLAAKYCIETDEVSLPKDVVPEPATMGLLALGLVGLVSTRRKRRIS